MLGKPGSRGGGIAEREGLMDRITVIDRATQAPEDRTVTLRPAPDAMAILTARGMPADRVFYDKFSV